MHSSRVIAVVSGVVLAGLVAAAVTLQLSSDATTTVDPARLVVGTGPPSTATATITYTDNQQDAATATCAFDFATGVADVSATASLT
ncbi:MAG TPA: hypothetical protein VKT18_00475, partial [Acidimicrobiales bacterium]|nr:hypothetical protein [Acidimicrobiales bacterium]